MKINFFDNLKALAPVMEEKLRHQVSTETSRRENYLLMRLNAKEQEVQELLVSFSPIPNPTKDTPILFKITC